MKRNIGVSIFLTIITCGIYGIYWMICLADELNILTRTNDMSGAKVFLLSLITCGIYRLYWMYVSGEKVDMLKNNRGLNSSYSGILFLILSLFGFDIVGYALMQDEINKNVQI